MRDKYEAFLFGFSVGTIIFCTLFGYVIGQTKTKMSKEKKEPSLPILKRVFPKTIPIAEFVTTEKKMSKVIVPNLKWDPNEFELEGEIIDNVKQKCLDGSIFEYYLVKTKYGINKYIKEEVKPKQR